MRFAYGVTEVAGTDSEGESDESVASGRRVMSAAREERVRCASQLSAGRYNGRTCFAAGEFSTTRVWVGGLGVDAPRRAQAGRGGTAFMLARHRAGRMVDERIMVARDDCCVGTCLYMPQRTETRMEGGGFDRQASRKREEMQAG